jgi:hypothetical protein
MTDSRVQFEASVWATVAVLAWAGSAHFNVATPEDRIIPD